MLTVNFSDAITLSELPGPIGRYFGRISDYLIKEKAAISVEICLAEVPGYHKTWDAAITNKLLLRDMEAAEQAASQKAEQEAERGYERSYDDWASDQAYRDEYASVGYL
jgi:hypothetical protein